MAKKTPLSVSSGFASQTQLNAEFTDIADHLNNKVLYRNNPSGEANQMESDLDMNSNRLMNLPAPGTATEAVRLVDLSDSDATGAASAQLRIDLASQATNYGASLVGTDAADTDSTGLWTTVQGFLSQVFNLFARNVDTVADLRGIAPSVLKRRVYLKAHTTEGDGGHGFFRAITGAAPGTYTDDNGIIIVPTGGDGSSCWRRVTDYITVPMFGGANDGTNASSAITSWLAAVRREYGTQIPATAPGTGITYDMHGAVLYMGEGVFGIIQPVDLSLLTNYTLLNPSLIALSGFTGTGMIEIYSNDGNPVQNILINGGHFQADWNAPTCLYAKDFYKLTVFNVTMRRYTNSGIKTHNVADGAIWDSHELNVLGGYYFQKENDYFETYPGGTAAGTAWDISNFDNNYVNAVVGYNFTRAAYFRKGAQFVSNCHFYTGGTSPLTIGDTKSLFDNCYFDFTPVVIEGTRNTITNSIFNIAEGQLAITFPLNPFANIVKNNKFIKTGTNTTVISMPTVAGDGRTTRATLYDNIFENCSVYVTRGTSTVNITAASVTFTVNDMFLPLSNYDVIKNAFNATDHTGYQFTSHYNSGTYQMTVNCYTVAGVAASPGGSVYAYFND